jgi:tetratricopeptide (TPR) repeat protein
MPGCRYLVAASFLLAPCQGPAQRTPDLQQGFAYLQAGNAEQARDFFEAILATIPDDRQAQDGEVKASEAIALKDRSAGDMADALQAMMRAQSFAANNAHLLFDLGVLEEEMRLYPNAETALTTAQQIDPKNPDIDYAMARVKIDEGQLDEAERNMKIYLQARPDDASAHYGLGRVYELGMHFDQAKAEFLRSTELQPVQTEAWYELGDIALKQNDFAAALPYFQKVLGRNGLHAGALADTGQALYREKRYDEAQVYLRRAVAAAPDYQPGHYYLGLTLTRLGQKEEAERELQTAQKLADEDNKDASRRYQLKSPSQ